ncbi:hypothetical protein WBG06_12780 [Nocardioides sp. CCNWLW239]|uniref:acyl-CoA dehydrogenase family protein n=1 Tax=Nocardioides sp. CCNWLW239 TaxID=3128902 RepID=UPI00301674BE
MIEPATAPASDRVLDEVREMLPQLSRSAAEVELNGSVDATVLRALDDAGFFGLLRPVSRGGVEADPVELFRGVRLLSRACLATGWVASMFGSHEWHLALFDDRAQDEVRAGGPGTYVASSYTPGGQLVPVPGGYRLSGRWRTSTGIAHASWVLLGSLLLDDDGRPVDFVSALVPAADYTVEQTWDPTGLRGVGADGLAVQDTFVPAYRTFGSTERTRQQDIATAATLRPLYRMPYATVHTHAVAAPLIGAAEGAYDALVADCPEVADVPAVARAQTDVHASWLQMTRNLRTLHEHARTNEPHDNGLVIRARRDQVLAAERSVRAIGVFLDAAGEEALDRRHPLQRVWRDAQVAITNAANAVDETLSIYGRWAYGMDIADRWW